MNQHAPEKKNKLNKPVIGRLQSKAPTPKTHSRQPSLGIKTPALNQALDQKDKNSYKDLGKTINKFKVKDTTEAVYNLYFGKVQSLKPVKKKVKRNPKSRQPRHLQYYQTVDQYTRKANKVTNKLSSSQKSLKKPLACMPTIISFQCKSQQSLKVIHTAVQSVLHQSPLLVQNVVRSVQISLQEVNNEICGWSGGSTKPFLHETPKELECRENYQIVHSTQFQSSSLFVEPNNQLDFVLAAVDESKRLQCNISLDYFKSQLKVTPRMRAQAIDWLQSLSEEIYIRRQTFHLSVQYFDMYLLIRPIQKTQLQLVAIASLMVAYSFQQKVPVGFVQVFESERPNGFTKQDILAMEIDLAMTLKFKFNVFTLAHWTNIFTDRWDQFISQPRVLGFSIIQENTILAQSVLIFKQQHLQLFNYVTTLIDTVMFSVDYRQLHKHQLALAALYLSLRMKVDAVIYNDQKPVSGFLQRYKKSSNPIFIDRHSFNEMFLEYLNQFGLQLSDLVSSCKHLFKILGVLEFACCGDADGMEVQHYNRYSLFYVTNQF